MFWTGLRKKAGETAERGVLDFGHIDPWILIVVFKKINKRGKSDREKEGERKGVGGRENSKSV